MTLSKATGKASTKHLNLTDFPISATYLVSAATEYSRFWNSIVNVTALCSQRLETNCGY